MQYHSGREFTSDDVKYTMLRLRDPTVGSGILAGFSNWFTSIDTPDKYTAVLSSDAPRPTFFDAIELINMVDKDTVEGPDAQSKVVGTGPFTFVEFQNGDHFTVAKNQNYWQSGTPYFDGIISYIRDQQAMDLQLESNALDVIKIPNVDDFVRLSKDPSYQAVIHPASGTFFEIGFNTVNPPFDNKVVRQAFNYAMDRQRFCDTIWQGTAQPIDLPWSQSSPAYDASKNGVYTYDLDKAKSLLQQAGVTNLEASILVNGVGAPQVLSFSQIYADSLSSIGVKLNIDNVEPAVWVDVLINKKPEYTGLWAGSDQIAQLAPSTLFQLSPGWRLDNNHSAFKDDMWTMLVNQSLSETDPEKGALRPVERLHSGPVLHGRLRHLPVHHPDALQRRRGRLSRPQRRSGLHAGVAGVIDAGVWGVRAGLSSTTWTSRRTPRSTRSWPRHARSRPARQQRRGRSAPFDRHVHGSVGTSARGGYGGARARAQEGRPRDLPAVLDGSADLCAALGPDVGADQRRNAVASVHLRFGGTRPPAAALPEGVKPSWLCTSNIVSRLFLRDPAPDRDDLHGSVRTLPDA